MKVILAKSFLAGPVSGADEAFVSYAIHLQQAGCLHSVALFYPPKKDDRYLARLRAAGIQVTCVTSYPFLHVLLMLMRKAALAIGFLTTLPHPRSSRFRRRWQHLTRWASDAYFARCIACFRRPGADVIHVVTPDAGAAVMIRAGHAAQVPVLYQELGTPHHMPELTVYYEQFAKVIPLCSEVAALSPSLAHDWQARFPSAHPISVLPLVFDSPVGRREPAAAVEGQVTFGFAARLEHGKGPLVLIDGFAQLRQQQRTGRLRLSGVGPLKEAAESRAAELNVQQACDFVGYVLPEAKSAFMQSLDVFVLPTLAEGTPNSLVEAMAHGLPVIASNVGGIPDMFCAESAILVPPGDAAALAAAMIRVAADADLRARMGRASRRRYEQLFSPAAVVPMLLETYRRVATRGGRPDSLVRAERSAHPWSSGGAGEETGPMPESKATRLPAPAGTGEHR